jgi:hypothetical protein
MPKPGRRTVLIIAGSAAALALGLGIALPTVAAAQDPTPSPSTSAITPDQKRAEHLDELAQGLATELGISKEKVAAALEKVLGQQRAQADADRLARLKERLATAVTEGKITQAQADAILNAAEAGVFPGGPGGHGPGRGPGPR